MKLTILTGPQGSGKSDLLKQYQYLHFGINYCADRLSIYPLHLPGFTEISKVIAFSNVEALQHFYILAAIMAGNELKFKTHLPGNTFYSYDSRIVITTQIPKRQLQHIYKGLPNVTFTELGKEKKVRNRKKQPLQNV